MQIGGGVRVGDAFQAIVGFNLMAIWGMWFCVEISQAGHSCLVRFEQERYAPTSDTGSAEGEERERVDWIRAEGARRSGAELVFDVRTRSIELGTHLK